jgi:hypothetical protein
MEEPRCNWFRALKRPPNLVEHRTDKLDPRLTESTTDNLLVDPRTAKPLTEIAEPKRTNCRTEQELAKANMFRILALEPNRAAERTERLLPRQTASRMLTLQPPTSEPVTESPDPNLLNPRMERLEPMLMKLRAETLPENRAAALILNELPSARQPRTEALLDIRDEQRTDKLDPRLTESSTLAL